MEFGGFGEPHAPFFAERRTRGLVQRCEVGKPGSPGFPVELDGFGKLHAPFFAERRTRGLVQRCEVGKPGPRVFLWNLMALANFMRLSLLKGARAAWFSAAR